jgi:hypothetical protein
MFPSPFDYEASFGEGQGSHLHGCDEGLEGRVARVLVEFALHEGLLARGAGAHELPHQRRLADPTVAADEHHLQALAGSHPLVAVEQQGHLRSAAQHVFGGTQPTCGHGRKGQTMLEQAAKLGNIRQSYSRMTQFIQRYQPFQS